jgi:hypothetical protein
MTRNGEGGSVSDSQNLSEAIITLRGPIERRKEVYYESIAL